MHLTIDGTTGAVGATIPAAAPCTGTLTVSDGEADATTTVTLTPARYTLRAQVSGLSGTGLVLRSGAADDLAVASNGTHTFSTTLYDGATYAISVHAQPATETCVLSGATGTLQGADVSATVTCTPYPVKAAGGGDHTCLLYSHGKIRCWGLNDEGQLGYGDTTNRMSVPADYVDVADVGDRIVDVGAGTAHTCALLQSGKVRCWGSWGSGAHGNDRYTFNDIGDGLGANETGVEANDTPRAAGDVETVTSAEALAGRKVTKLAVGVRHTCVLLDSGGVRCWGWGSNGRLGYGNTNTVGEIDSAADKGDVALGGTAVDVSAQFSHTCALLSTGVVKCWGDQTGGRLGNEASAGVSIATPPVSGVDVGGPVLSLAAAGSGGSTCVRMQAQVPYAEGDVKCWGPANYGRLGLGNTTSVGDDPTRPVSGVGKVELGASGTVTTLTMGFRVACVLLSNGKVNCWGEDAHGKLGRATGASPNDIGDNETPGSLGPINVGEDALSLSSSNAGVAQDNTQRSHICVVTVSRALRCWGANGSGQLGYGHSDDVGDNETPASVGVVPLPAP